MGVENIGIHLEKHVHKRETLPTSEYTFERSRQLTPVMYQSLAAVSSLSSSVCCLIYHDTGFMLQAIENVVALALCLRRFRYSRWASTSPSAAMASAYQTFERGAARSDRGSGASCSGILLGYMLDDKVLSYVCMRYIYVFPATRFDWLFNEKQHLFQTVTLLSSATTHVAPVICACTKSYTYTRLSKAPSTRVC